MLLLTIFWALIAIPRLLYFLKREPMPLLLAASSFLIVGMLTKDPLFSAFGVPLEFEWAVGTGIVLFGAWHFYLHPMNRRLVRTEQDISGINGELRHMRTDITLIKHLLLARE
ncbi:hypothetical protein AUJ68_07310 [Candidatus Woesearchaeota archaeon CG1_02_57_44]|nr:MAG: hypothetical protein AUJ68_07310 [Candidatus Woesearchaeota archaeon CG1_02_57_44]